MKTKRRIYVPDAALAAGAEVVLGDAQSHYLTTVLRLAAGAEVHLFNAAHGEWLGEIETTRKGEVKLKIRRQTRPISISHSHHLTLSFSPLKKDRTDFLVEKASELGVHFLQPVFTDHTQSDRVNIERLQTTAIEAAEQCDRLDAPQVLEPVKLQNYLQDLLHNSENLPDDILLFLAAESGDAMPIATVFSSLSSSGPSRRRVSEGRRSPGIHSKDNPMYPANRENGTVDPRVALRAPEDDTFRRNIHFLIGPEGGFSDAEFARFDRYPNIRRMRLGPRLLRAETAAVAVLSAFQAIAGDWN